MSIGTLLHITITLTMTITVVILREFLDEKTFHKEVSSIKNLYSGLLKKPLFPSVSLLYPEHSGAEELIGDHDWFPASLGTVSRKSFASLPLTPLILGADITEISRDILTTKDVFDIVDSLDPEHHLLFVRDDSTGTRLSGSSLSRLKNDFGRAFRSIRTLFLMRKGAEILQIA